MKTTFISIFLVIFIFVFSGYSQLIEISSPLLSKGEIPGFLKTQTESFFFPEVTKKFRGVKKKDKSYYLSQIYSSNMIVFGDEISTYCQELLLKSIGQKVNVFLVRSNSKLTFSNQEKDIFITTGIISQITNEVELLFVLLREIEVINSNAQLAVQDRYYEEKVFLYDETTVDGMVKIISTYPSEVESQLDLKAFESIKKVSNCGKKILESYYNICLSNNTPFYEKKIDWNYFNNNHVYIPVTEFLKMLDHQPEYYNAEKTYPEIASRKKKNVGEHTVEFEVYNKDFIVDKLRFLKIIELSRLESILIENIQGNFYYALYEIYILESNNVKNAFLDYMKAYAWLGIVKQKNNEIDIRQYFEYYLSDNEGALFCRFIRMQNIEVLLALAIRNIYDVKLKYRDNSSLSFMFEDVVRIAANSQRFKLELFTKKDYKALLNEHNQFVDSITNVNSNLIDKNAQFKLSKGLDSLQYHLYMLPDLVVDEDFKAQFDSLKSGQMKVKKSIDKVEIYSFDISLFSRGKQKGKQMDDAFYDDLNKDVSTRANLEIQNVDKKELASDLYNTKYILNASIIQYYYHTKYVQKIIPIFADQIIQDTKKMSTEVLGILAYKHEYCPKVRGIHFTGLVVFTLPYLIPEYFYRGNNSVFEAFYFNTHTGQIASSSIHRYKDPYNKYALKNNLFQSLLPLKN